MIQNILCSSELSEYHTELSRLETAGPRTPSIELCSNDFVFDNEKCWRNRSDAGFHIWRDFCPTQYFAEAFARSTFVAAWSMGSASCAPRSGLRLHRWRLVQSFDLAMFRSTP